MSSIWRNSLGISLFGESHGHSIGVTIDNIPCGHTIDIDKVYEFMKRRSSSFYKETSTKRHEPDIPEIISGIFNQKTTGAPLTAIIKNKDVILSSYEQIKYTPRPGHADYTYMKKYKGFHDYRGAGHASGRLTAGLTFAGAILSQILEKYNIHCCAHIKSIGKIKDISFDPVYTKKSDFDKIKQNKFPVINNHIVDEINHIINIEKRNTNSLGGQIECCILGVPCGIGSPIFGNLKSVISSLVFSIPAVKGIEFGNGFKSAFITGYENNDDFFIDETESVKTRTNNHGGILGGITSGMPIIFNVAIKPTSSISKQQNTINVKTKKNTTITVKGRHDPCIVPRAVSVIESAAIISIFSEMLKENHLNT